MKAYRLHILALVLLTSAVVLVLVNSFRLESRNFTGELRGLLPTATRDWTAEERPIAETEEMRRAVGSVLNYDEGVLMRYSRGRSRIDVYLAYWSPGKMNYREVASHTPDVCWIEAGWKRMAVGTAHPGVISGKKLEPGEARIFKLNGVLEHVWFWHLIGDRVHSYKTHGSPAWHATITDAFTWGLHQRKEQFFIRISSNEPLEGFIADPLLIALLEKLPLPRSAPLQSD